MNNEEWKMKNEKWRMVGAWCECLGEGTENGKEDDGDDPWGDGHEATDTIGESVLGGRFCWWPVREGTSGVEGVVVVVLVHDGRV